MLNLIKNIITNKKIIFFFIILIIILLLLFFYQSYYYLYIRKNKLNDYSKEIQQFIPKRNLIPIKNNYKIKNYLFDNYDYHVIIYWIDDYDCNIILRRLDDFEINSSLQIKLYSLNKKDFEIIKIKKPENNNEIILNYKTTIKLVKTNLNQIQNIPKIIIQTGKTTKLSNACFNAIQTFIDLNPEYDYKFFDDNECIEFIKINFNNDVLNAYNKLIPGAYKADLFRYCVLYIIGGCYFDIKQILRVPLREIINPSEDIILTQDTYYRGYYNAIMLSKPKHPLMLKLINQVVKNVFNNYYGTCPLCPTGPCLLYKLAKHIKPKYVFNISFFHHESTRFKTYIYYKNKKIISPNYHGYYKINDPRYYSNLWFLKQIYK
jgi:mannosyltransferase OCH1-like enzyme